MTAGSSSFRIGAWQLRVSVGDLTSLHVDVGALVSSDDNYLSHSGGVSAALWSAGRLADLPRPEPGDVRLGDVAVGQAGDLSAEFILHAITVDLDEGRSAKLSEVARLYGLVIDTAIDLGVLT